MAPPTGGEEGSSAEFFEEIRKLLADFNVSIQEESKDRKLRFHVKRLIKSHQQRGEDVDEELDFYMDDDDGDLACLSHRHIRRASSSLPLLFLSAVAVLFTMEDSSKVFAIGNIEQVAVADGTVDARRATRAAPATVRKREGQNTSVMAGLFDSRPGSGQAPMWSFHTRSGPSEA